jgi:hypothetical protein
MQMSFSTMIFPPTPPPSFFRLASDKISSLSTYHAFSTIAGLGLTAKALFDIRSANSKIPEIKYYLHRAIAGLVSTAVFSGLGIFCGSIALSVLGCVGVVYTGWRVYQIANADPSLKLLVSRAYFGLAVIVLIPAIGAGLGGAQVIWRILCPDEVTICGPVSG